MRFTTKIILKKENIIKLKVSKCFLKRILIASNFNTLRIIRK